MALASSSSARMSCAARVRTVQSARARPMSIARAAATRSPAQAGIEAVTGTEAGELIKDGWKVLDVRPPEEVSRVRQVGSRGEWCVGVHADAVLVARTLGRPEGVHLRSATSLCRSSSCRGGFPSTRPFRSALRAQ
jgi:hypothetical protein